MWKWRKSAKSPNIFLPKAGKLLKTIKEFPFDTDGAMELGSVVLFIFSEKVCVDGPGWNNKPIELWLFHFLVNGERTHLRWYEEVPLPGEKGFGIVTFDWTEYWEYIGVIDEI